MKMRIVLISLIGLLLASCGKSNENEKGIRLPDNWIEQMPIAKIEPHEYVTCLGVGKTPEIFIAYFRVSSNATN
ncbi:MAG: hypothetical protein OXI61_07640 [Candidatus Poribacteria bacterium]|nr:hypothetical protein [Candidatus Poribacteria bacterium]